MAVSDFVESLVLKRIGSYLHRIGWHRVVLSNECARATEITERFLPTARLVFQAAHYFPRIVVVSLSAREEAVCSDLMHPHLSQFFSFCGLGWAVMIFWGQQAYKMLSAVRLQMRDPKVVEGLFYRFDENRNGCKSLRNFY